MRRDIVLVLSALLVMWMTVPTGGSPSVAAAGPGTPGTPGTPLRIDHQLTPDDGVLYNQLSPDGEWVIYKAGEALFSVPTTGGNPVQLTPQLTGDQFFFATDFSPDSRHVLFASDHAATGTHHLYAVPVGGGQPTRLSSGVPAGSEVDEYVVTPDSQHVIFRADETSLRDMGLYSVPLAGGTPMRLHPAAPDLAYIERIEVSPDSSTVVFTADDIGLGSVPVGGGSVAQLEGPDLPQPQISPDSQWVFYLGDEDHQGDRHVRRVAIGGGTPENVSQGHAGLFELAADSSRVVWIEDGNLMSAPIAGGTAGTIGSANLFAITPDSSTVIYARTTAQEQVRAVDIAGSNDRLVAALPAGQAPWRLWPSADSQNVAYTLDARLVVAQIDGGPVTVDHAAGGDVAPVLITADSTRVVFGVESGAGRDLFAVPIGGGDVIELTNTAMQGGELEDVALTADSQRAVFTANASGGGTSHVWSVLIGWACGTGFATLVGTPGADIIHGTNGADVIVGFGGADTVYAKRGPDVVCGGAGADAIYGGHGNDILYGNGGGDDLFGGIGRDLLFGGNGNDVIRGGNGNDVLRGQGGNDELRGGPKTDTCYGSSGFDSASGCETIFGVP